MMERKGMNGVCAAITPTTVKFYTHVVCCRWITLMLEHVNSASRCGSMPSTPERPAHAQSASTFPKTFRWVSSRNDLTVQKLMEKH